MALQIPRSNLPQVAPQAVRAPLQRPSMDASNFGGGQAVADALGQARGLAGDVSGIVYREEMRAQETLYNKLSAKLEAEEMAQRDFLSNAKGEAALKASQDALSNFDKRANEILEKEATAPGVKERLASRMDRNRLALEAFSRDHTKRERESFELEALDGNLQNIENAAIKGAGDPLHIALKLDEQHQALKRHAALTGKPKEWLQAESAKRESRIHQGVIDSLLASGKDIHAKDYYEANKASILGMAQADVERAVNTGSTLGEAQRVTDSLSGLASLSDARSRLKAMGLSPGVRQQADQMLAREYGLRDQAIQEQKQARLSTALKDIDKLYGRGKTAMEQAGKPLSVEILVGPHDWDHFDADEQAKLRDYFDGIQKAEGIQTKAAVLSRLHGMSRQELAAYSEAKFTSEFLVGLDKETYNHAKKLWQDASGDAAAFDSLKTKHELIFDGVRLGGLGGGAPTDTLKSIADTDSKGKRVDPAGEAKETAYKLLYDRVETRWQALWADKDRKTKPTDADLKRIVGEESSKLKRNVRVVRDQIIPTETGGERFEREEVIDFARLKRGDKAPLNTIPPQELSKIKRLFSSRVGSGKYTDSKAQRLWIAMEMGDDSYIESILDEKD